MSKKNKRVVIFLEYPDELMLYDLQFHPPNTLYIYKGIQFSYSKLLEYLL